MSIVIFDVPRLPPEFEHGPALELDDDNDNDDNDNDDDDDGSVRPLRAQMRMHMIKRECAREEDAITHLRVRGGAVCCVGSNEGGHCGREVVRE